MCTNHEVERTVIRKVKKANPKSIVLTEAAAIGCNTMECYEVSGIADVALEEGVERYDIKTDNDLAAPAPCSSTGTWTSWSITRTPWTTS